MLVNDLEILYNTAKINISNYLAIEPDRKK